MKIILTPKGKGKRSPHTLEQPGTFLFGRSSDCQFQLPAADSTASSLHFALEIEPGAVRVRDLGSLNGTYVNGVKYGGLTEPDAGSLLGDEFPAVDLRHGDEVQAGVTHFSVSIDMPERAPEPEPEPVPSGISKYKIERTIGQGGLGSVYLARRIEDNTAVCLRTLPPLAQGGEYTRQMFRREAEMASSLRHPNVIEVHEFDIVGETLYMATEYCPESVDTLMWHRGGKLPLEEAIPIMLGVLDGLEYLHQRGIVHRDVKPGNIMLAGTEGAWQPKLSDFGLACAYRDDSDGHPPHPGAPERGQGMPRPDPLGDVWAAGATLYNMLTGQFPCDWQWGLSILRMVDEGHTAPIRDVDSSVPILVAEAIDQALAGDVTERFQTAAAFHDALVRASYGSGHFPRTVFTTSPGTEMDDVVLESEDDGATPDPAAFWNVRSTADLAESDYPAAFRDAHTGALDPWAIGNRIEDDYEVTAILGEGELGRVHRVFHRGWGEDLVARTPAQAILGVEDAIERFVRGAEQWKSLGLHPNIVPCYYTRTIGDVPCVFAQYVSDDSLAERVRSRSLYDGGPRRALERILDVGVQIARALEHAHQRGLGHGRLDPSCVFVARDGEARVADFGLGRAFEGEAPVDSAAFARLLADMFAGERRQGDPADALAALAGGAAADGAMPRMPEPLVAVAEHCLAAPADSQLPALDAAGRALERLYLQVTGRPYARRAQEPAAAGAGSLNNLALAHLDLGQEEEALAAWQAALAADPHHPETTYNRGVYLWRHARMTDSTLVRQLGLVRASAGATPQLKRMLARVHIERGDTDAAQALLEKALRQQPGSREFEADLRAARSNARIAGRSARVFEGHDGTVASARLNDDAQFAISAGSDATVRVWEVSTGRCVRVFEGHEGPVASVVLSADERFALSGGSDATARLWDMAAGVCTATLAGHTDTVQSVWMSEDGAFAVTSSADATIRLWEMPSGACVEMFVGHTEGVTSARLFAGGTRIVSGSADGTIKLWDVATGHCGTTLEGHEGPVASVALGADEARLLSAGADGSVRLWDVETGEQVAKFEGHSAGATSACMSDDGSWVLSGGKDATLRLWDVETGRCLRTFEGHLGPVTSTHMEGDAGWALSASTDGTMRLWDLPSESVAYCTWQLSHAESGTGLLDAEAEMHELLSRSAAALREGYLTSALALARRARELPGCGRASEALERWASLYLVCRRSGLRAGWPVGSLEGGGVGALCLSGDGRWALSSTGAKLRLWDMGTRACLWTLDGHSAAVRTVFLSEDGQKALSGGDDATLQLWEVDAGRSAAVFSGHESAVNCACLSGDGRWALSGSDDTTVRLWDVSTGRTVRTYQGHGGAVTALGVSGDWRLALTSSADGTLRLWELASGRCLRVFTGHAGGVNTVCMSADGFRALSGGEDAAVRLWDVAAGRAIRVFEGHRAGVTSACMSADGRFSLSGCAAGTIRLWDMSTGHCVWGFEDEAGPIRGALLSGDGRFAIAGGAEAPRLWELDWELEASEPAGWDEGARPYLESFLAASTPYAAGLAPDHEPSEEELRRALDRQGKPTWTERDFQALLRRLQHAGYGWLTAEGVRAEAERSS